jgi:hypothetical protein
MVWRETQVADRHECSGKLESGNSSAGVACAARKCAVVGVHAIAMQGHGCRCSADLR